MPSSALVVVNDGRIGLAKIITNLTLYLGIGSLNGTTPWTINDTPPNFSTSATKLENELVRRSADLVQYLVSDAGGDIITDTAERFSVGGYSIGATDIQIDTLVGGTLSDLLPIANPKSGFGRTVVNGATTHRITALDAGSSIITLTPALTSVMLDNAALSTPLITAIPSGQKQLTYPTEVFSPGDLLIARNISPLIRNPGSRTQLDIIFNI
jgi:hypothetical protein